MSSKTRLARIDRNELKEGKILLPNFTPNEIYKIGKKVLVGIDKSGEFIYGKKIWKNIKRK